MDEHTSPTHRYSRHSGFWLQHGDPPQCYPVVEHILSIEAAPELYGLSRRFIAEQWQRCSCHDAYREVVLRTVMSHGFIRIRGHRCYTTFEYFSRQGMAPVCPAILWFLDYGRFADTDRIVLSNVHDGVSCLLSCREFRDAIASGLGPKESPYPQVFPRICISDFDTARHVDAVVAYGYTAVLNVSETDYGDVMNDRVEYQHIPLIDSADCDFTRFIDAVESLHHLLLAGHKVVVHCQAGISRSPAVTAAYLVRYRLEELLQLWGTAEPMPLPADFEYSHHFLDDPAQAALEGLPVCVLDDPVFAHVVTAFKVMALARQEIFLRPDLWGRLFPRIRNYLIAGDDHDDR